MDSGRIAQLVRGRLADMGILDAKDVSASIEKQCAVVRATLGGRRTIVTVYRAMIPAAWYVYTWNEEMIASHAVNQMVGQP